jgi:GTP-binding protein
MTAPLVAIVGRPNVGKSTLYNRMVGGRPALVHDTPGLTRDRRYGELDYYGRELRVVDTGGLDPEAEADVIGAGIHRQAWRAVDEADAVILVVDGNAGVTPLDREVAAQVRKTGKPVILAANKIDSPKRDGLVVDLYELGIGEPFPISAAHGRGVDTMVEALIALLPAPPVTEADFLADTAGADGDEDEDDAEPDEEALLDENGDPLDPALAQRRAREKARDAAPLRVAFVGKPNAGKSSLTNRLLGEERSLVHDVPGTTTDPVDSAFEMGGRQYVLVDTAGIRRKAKVDEDVEKIAVTMALSQIERADVCILAIDASLGPSEQDARLAGAIEQAGKALVIALNKSDLIGGDAAHEALRQLVKDTFHFLPWAPTLLLSAQRGDGVDRLMDLVDKVAKQHKRRVTTSEINRFFAEVCEVVPPPIHRGLPVRIQYMTQGAVRPPTFILWANHPKGVSPSYRRFLINQLRKRYGFRGTPIRIFVKEKQGRNKRKGDS